MRHQAAVGIDSFLDVGEVTVVDDAVEAFGAPDQHTGAASGQGIGGQFPGRLAVWQAVEQFDVASRVGQQ